MNIKTMVSSVLLVAIGAFLWWLISPMFIDEVHQDELDPTLQEALENELIKTEEASAPASAVSLVSDTSTTNDLPRTFIDGPFPIIGTSDHPASGEVEVIYSPEETLLRYKNYDGTNDPDLKIYLAKDLEAREYLSLGDARGNEGTLIYGVPLDVDLDDYRYVLTWDEASGELFDYVEIR